MTFAARTPEALLPRSDSKNPATTCRGITTAGRPCRRALAASPQCSPSPSPSRGSGVVAVLDEEHAAAFFCYQHKDQAEQLVAKNRQKTSLHRLKERSSLDTLAERAGILDIDEDIPEPQKIHHRRHKHDTSRVKRRDTLPSGWNEMQSPLMSVPDEMVQQRPRPLASRSDRNESSNLKFSWSCCLRADSEDDDEPPPKVSHRPLKASRNSRPFANTGQYEPQPEMQAASPGPGPPKTTIRPSLAPTPGRPSLGLSPTHSQTHNLLSLMPSSLSPQTTSLLLNELSRPISPSDDTGYIYIFWLTPESEDSTPDDETASTLLDGDDYEENEYGGLYPSLMPTRAQRTNRTLERYASVRHPSRAVPAPQAQVQRTILLKIGRAANVHRRMSQWTKQCGQNINLIRYYPYTSSNPKAHALSTSNSLVQGRKVPHVHRVERLIHLELAEKRVVKPECQACGREHREWFEIEASRGGLKSVDEVVRRWVEWAEKI
ncbi:uncharacterized protein A1O9_03192 [Exophiala aquamarina CBS 119918]|uniref:Bacteriophage T5 Orf172 DNA-binding domain-containing protein n=1 Tax=Exophiala aquamarina CBS 119918 TaxID=1182545 RepID=A0A072PNF4_9EURO|nr:uncharacterized protein A1O9_03192 [Exophiala aquamarina CBS 119918]KEF61624.1 hypothetical protein A1O9_03192 [Exophiala aquamarina CBS 119918]